jgi:hypothetical protein
MKLRCRSAEKRQGFAQGDVILVLAAVLVLGSVALSFISKSRENSRMAQCLVNVKVLNDAVLSQAQDNGNRLLTTKAIPAPGGWWSYKDKIRSYIKKGAGGGVEERLFACPSDRGYSQETERQVPFWRSPKHSFTSYVFNGVTLPGIPNVSGRQLSSIREPSKTLLVMEWVAHGPLSWHRSRTGQANMPFYDGAECVVGFVDGHAGLTRIHFDGINAAYTRDPAPGYDYRYSGD